MREKEDGEKIGTHSREGTKRTVGMDEEAVNFMRLAREKI